MMFRDMMTVLPPSADHPPNPERILREDDARYCGSDLEVDCSLFMFAPDQDRSVSSTPEFSMATFRQVLL